MVQITRRSFTASLAAGVALPAMPVVARSGTAAHVATHHQRLWAEAIARGHGRASAGLLSQHLGMAQDAASDLLRDLVSENVLRAPDASGLYRAVQPAFDAARTVPSAPGSAIKKLGKVLDHVSDLEDDIPPPEYPAPADADQAAAQDTASSNALSHD